MSIIIIINSAAMPSICTCNQQTGFSFGGLIACSLAAELVKIAFVRPETLRSRLMVITFGQPLIEMPLVKEIMKKHPCFREMVHCVFAEVDVLPQILSYLQEECRLKSSPSTSAITKVRHQFEHYKSLSFFFAD